MRFRLRIDSLSFRMFAAGALLLLSMLPLAFSSSGRVNHPVSGYDKMAAPVHVLSEESAH